MRCPTRLWRVLLLVGLVAAAGCRTRVPDFMTRVHEDCVRGDKWACDLIDALEKPVPVNEIDTRDSVDPAGTNDYLSRAPPGKPGRNPVEPAR